MVGQSESEPATTPTTGVSSCVILRPFGGFQRIGKQHGDGHRADAAGHRRDRAGDFLDAVEVDVAAELAVRQTVDADVDDDGTGLDHVGGDELRTTDGSDQHIGAFRVEGKILRLRMADRDGGAGLQQQHRHRLADDVGTPMTTASAPSD